MPFATVGPCWTTSRCRPATSRHPPPSICVRETHVAFTAVDRGSVDRVHAAALDAGAEILHAPRVWPEYHPTYYGVFLRDLDGNNVEAVSHR